MAEASALPLPEGMTDREVREYQNKWELPHEIGGYRLAVSWLTKLRETYYAMAFLVPFTIGEDDGCILVTSTSTSASVYAENCKEYEQTYAITNPHWQYFEVFWYPGLALLNFYDLGTMPGESIGPFTLGQFLDEYKGSQWRVQYCNIRPGRMFLETFRDMLRHVCLAHNWLEISCGRSYQKYRALDLYVRVISAGMKNPMHEAWFLLNASVDVSSRAEPRPEFWWWYPDLKSWGQRRVMTEWYLEISGAVMTATAGRRYHNLMRQVNPTAVPKARM